MLSRLLSDKAPEPQIFKHIVTNAGTLRDSGPVEQYLLQLLQAHNLTAATALSLKVLHDNSELKFSNQFWSLFLARATSHAHTPACALIYHEVINPHVKYTRTKVQQTLLDNEHIPFLVLPSALPVLASIFVHAGNHMAVSGLRAYFKRFYSYIYHRDVYEALCLARVEAYAQAGLMEQALDAYNDLALKYRGHMKYRDPKLASHSLKYAVHINSRQRQKNIAQNIRKGKKLTGLVYNPEYYFNKYTLPGMSFWAMLDGHLELGDLPIFRGLLTAHVSSLIEKDPFFVEPLLSFILQNHHSLSRFVAYSLVRLSHPVEALALVKRVREQYAPIYNLGRFSTCDEFTEIVKGLRKLILSKSHDSLALHDMLLDCYNLCKNTSKLGLSYKFRCAFLNAYVMSPFALADIIGRIVLLWDRRPYLIDEDSYARAQALAIAPSILTAN